MSARDVFIGGLFGAGLLDNDEYLMLKAAESNARKYFPCCPICGSGRIQVLLVGETTVSCEKCGAKWKLNISFWKGLKTAELIMVADDGSGEKLLGKEIETSKWLEMAEESRRKLRAQHKSNSNRVAKN